MRDDASSEALSGASLSSCNKRAQPRGSAASECTIRRNERTTSPRPMTESIRRAYREHRGDHGFLQRRGATTTGAAEGPTATTVAATRATRTAIRRDTTQVTPHPGYNVQDDLSEYDGGDEDDPESGMSGSTTTSSSFYGDAEDQGGEHWSPTAKMPNRRRAFGGQFGDPRACACMHRLQSHGPYVRSERGRRCAECAGVFWEEIFRRE